MTAINSAGESSPVTVNINITNIIDDEPILNSADFSVTENTIVGTTIGTVELNSTGTSAITGMRLSGIGSETFSIDANGTLRLESTLDYETQNMYQIKAIATNSKADSAEANVTIEIINVPEFAPVIKPLTLNVEENTPVGTIIGQIKEGIGGDSHYLLCIK